MRFHAREHIRLRLPRWCRRAAHRTPPAVPAPVRGVLPRASGPAGRWSAVPRVSLAAASSAASCCCSVRRISDPSSNSRRSPSSRSISVTSGRQSSSWKLSNTASSASLVLRSCAASFAAPACGCASSSGARRVSTRCWSCFSACDLFIVAPAQHEARAVVDAMAVVLLVALSPPFDLPGARHGHAARGGIDRASRSRRS